MKATQQLHNLGQSLWLDNITRDLLNNGTMCRHVGKSRSFSISEAWRKGRVPAFQAGILN
ncbi:MAG TPA: hypothetical protein VHZ55_24980 [Bryobacteraceae bacterium]|jgi:hypothetical protein|nr:hypothetical protein [Bryobacteraceae bacterium]